MVVDAPRSQPQQISVVKGNGERRQKAPYALGTTGTAKRFILLP